MVYENRDNIFRPDTCNCAGDLVQIQSADKSDILLTIKVECLIAFLFEVWTSHAPVTFTLHHDRNHI